MHESKTFSEATKTCNEYGGEILNLKNQKEWDFYRNYLKNQGISSTIWLGIRAEHITNYLRPDGSELYLDAKDWCGKSNFFLSSYKVLFNY
jgi:hypothetical protein